MLFISAPVGAVECYVITGIDSAVDANRVFRSYTQALKNDQLILAQGSLICKRVRDYAELKNLIDPKITQKLLLLHASHGDPGGNVSCDTGNVSGDEILNFLRDTSLHRPVAYLSEACYGGDLILKKLIYDEAHPASKSIDNLCMLSHSSFETTCQPSVYLTALQKYLGQTGDLLKIYRDVDEGIFSGQPIEFYEFLDRKDKSLSACTRVVPFYLYLANLKDQPLHFSPHQFSKAETDGCSTKFKTGVATGKIKTSFFERIRHREENRAYLGTCDYLLNDEEFTFYLAIKEAWDYWVTQKADCPLSAEVEAFFQGDSQNALSIDFSRFHTTLTEILISGAQTWVENRYELAYQQIVNLAVHSYGVHSIAQPKDIDIERRRFAACAGF